MLNIICPSHHDRSSSCSQNLGVHATCATSRNLKKTQTCVAKQSKFFSGNLEETQNLCACATCVTSGNPKETQNLCACVTHVTSGNPEESQIFEMDDTLDWDRSFEIA